VAALNTRFSDRSVFSGVNSDAQALPDAAAILTALEAATAGAVTVTDVQTAIDTWFADPLGYAAAYGGGGPRTPVQVAPGETADLSITAMDPALTETLKGLATVALLGRGVLAGQPAAQEALAQGAGAALLSAGNARTDLMARIGTVQAHVAQAETRNTTEGSALAILRVGIVGADPFDAATKLQDLQTRLEALYLITARVSRLSLAEYI
jgi:flagellar hook-associated protein 3 FlgL